MTDTTTAPTRKDTLGVALDWAELGVPALFIEGGTKRPYDMRAAGDRPAGSRGGVHTATTDPAAIRAAYDRYIAEHADADDELARTPNLAVALTGPHLVVVDADTPAAVDHLRELYAGWSGGDALPGPTETTPGVQADDGEWRHRDGGHWFFAVPDGLPEGVRSRSLGEGEREVSVLAGARYAVTAPSERPEGSYAWIGNVYEAPAGLVALVSATAERGAASAPRDPLPVDSAEYAWVEANPFADALAADGWEETTGVSACGCGEWTAPGRHASPKSATLHELTCGEAAYAGKLHIWTDSLPSELATWVATHGPMVSRLEYETAMRFSGQMRWARAQLEVPHPDDEAVIAAAEAAGFGGTAPAQIYRTSQAEFMYTGQVTELSAQPTALAEEVQAEEDVPHEASSAADPGAFVAYIEKELGRALTAEETKAATFFVKHGEDVTSKKFYPLGYFAPIDLVRKIFCFSQVTQAIYHAALSRGDIQVSPLVRLADELLRVGRRAPVTLKTPTGAPLSTYVLAVGASGAGKTTALDSRASLWPAYPVLDSPTAAFGVGTEGFYDPDATFAPASGEALVDQFLVAVQETDPETGKTTTTYEPTPRPSATLAVDEFTGLLRRMGRDGSTLATTLTEMWSMAATGSTSRSRGEARLDCDYALFMKGGLQPLKATSYLDLADLGVPQRVVHIPATWLWGEIDLGVPDPGQVEAPAVEVDGAHRMTACNAVAEEMRHWRRLTSITGHVVDNGEAVDVAVRSHETQVRIRVAALAALLHGELHISDDLWEWSGWLMEVSRRTLAWVTAVLDGEAAHQAETRGRARAHERRGELDEADAFVDEVADRLRGLLTRAGAKGETEGRLKNGLAKGKRGHLRAALARLTDDGVVVRHGPRYYLAAALRTTA